LQWPPQPLFSRKVGSLHREGLHRRHSETSSMCAERLNVVSNLTRLLNTVLLALWNLMPVLPLIVGMTSVITSCSLLAAPFWSWKSSKAPPENCDGDNDGRGCVNLRYVSSMFCGFGGLAPLSFMLVQSVSTNRFAQLEPLRRCMRRAVIELEACFTKCYELETNRASSSIQIGAHAPFCVSVVNQWSIYKVEANDRNAL